MIPDGWKGKSLGEIAIFMMGYAFSSNDFCEDGVPLIRMGNLYQNRLSLDRNTVFLPMSFIERYENLKINHGDILISMTGTMGKQDYGYAVLIPDDSPLMLLNQRVTKINCKEYNSQEYLLYLLRSELVLKQIYSHPGGTKQANLSIKQLCGITVKVPPLLEQCRIAEILGVWDESIDLLERLILEFRLRKKVKGSQG